MTSMTRTLFKKVPCLAVLCLLAMSLLYAHQAGAIYFIDGSVGTDPLTYDNPNDGQCVVGIRMNAGNAEFLVDKSITNYRDCVAYTTNLTTMTTQATCAPAASGTTLGVGTSGWRHNWAAGVCVSGANGISRVDLDNTAAMCTSEGGTIGTACVAYGWLYRGIDPVTGAAPPFTGSPAAAPFDTSNYTVWHGVDSTTGNGFCYAAMDFTAAPSGGYTIPLSTSWPDPGNPNACPMFDPNNATGRARTGTTWSDYVWNWKSNPEIGAVPPTTGTICRNAYGVKGMLVTAITASVAGNAYTVGPKYDLTVFTDQAKCVANGFSWEPSVRTTGFVDATVRGVMSATPCGSSTDCYAGVDITTPGNAGGGKFVSRQCLKCHSDQSRGFMELDKPGFVETPHKQAGDSSDPVIAGIGNNAPWRLKGIQCSICHAASNPERLDVINKNNSGAFIGTSAHENASAGAGVTQVCYHCHSDATLGVSANTTPAAVIPVSGGDFAENGQHLAPIVNEFLNSPHAQYSGSNNGGQLRDATKYGSSFIGYNCKTAGSVPATQSLPDAPGGTVAWNATNCPAAGHKWATAPTTGTANAACYFTATSCVNNAVCTGPGAPVACCIGLGTGTCVGALGNTWNTTYDKLNYPFGGTGNELCTASKVPWSCCTGAGTGTCVNIGDNGACTGLGAPMSCCTGSGTGTCSTGVCSGIGLGSSTTTVYQSGVAKKIGFPDSTTNTNCTNPGDGSATSGAVAYWVREGKDNYPLAGGTFTSQGSCMTCHDLHWDFDSTNPEAEPFRRECTTCHMNPGTSASGAPQIDVATINHLPGTGTPLENVATKPWEACEICHMPASSEPASSVSSFMHLWRISTDAAYETMGATQANKLCAGGANVGAVCTVNSECPGGTCGAWVDIDHACGQCHGGGTVEDAEHKSNVSLCTAAGVPEACCTGLGTGTCARYRTRASLASVAEGMHDSAGVNYPVTFSIDVGADGLTVDVSGSVICTGDCSGLTYDWNWGEGVNGSGQTASHTYSSAGRKSIKLTVRNSLGKSVGSATRSVTLTKADVVPTADAVCTWDADTWTMSVTDNSTDVGDTTPLLKAIVDWDDSSTSIGAPGGTLIHKYYSPGTYTVTLTAIDTVLNSDTKTCTAIVADAFSISGTVKTPLGAALGGATVVIKKGARVVKVVKTSAVPLTLGQFEATSLRPGTYKLLVRKYRYTFAVPGPTVTVGPSLFTNASCTAAGSPVECCTGAGTGSCTPPIDITAITGP